MTWVFYAFRKVDMYIHLHQIIKLRFIKHFFTRVYLAKITFAAITTNSAAFKIISCLKENYTVELHADREYFRIFKREN